MFEKYSTPWKRLLPGEFIFESAGRMMRRILTLVLLAVIAAMPAFTEMGVEVEKRAAAEREAAQLAQTERARTARHPGAQ